MTGVLVVGMAVVDFVFGLDELPDQPIKYIANAAEVVGGGCAANAELTQCVSTCGEISGGIG